MSEREASTIQSILRMKGNFPNALKGVCPPADRSVDQKGEIQDLKKIRELSRLVWSASQVPAATLRGSPVVLFGALRRFGFLLLRRFAALFLVLLLWSGASQLTSFFVSSHIFVSFTKGTFFYVVVFVADLYGAAGMRKVCKTLRNNENS